MGCASSRSSPDLSATTSCSQSVMSSTRWKEVRMCSAHARASSVMPTRNGLQRAAAAAREQAAGALATPSDPRTHSEIFVECARERTSANTSRYTAPAPSTSSAVQYRFRAQ